MKRVWAACIILVLIIALCFVLYGVLDRSVTTLSEQILEARQVLLQGDFIEADRLMEVSYASWSADRPMLETIFRHHEIDEIQTLYLRTLQGLDNRDANEFLLQSRELNGMLLHLREIEQPILSNIF